MVSNVNYIKKEVKTVSYLVDNDTCKQFQKQNRQRTALCLDGNIWRTKMKRMCGCSAVSLLCYNHFIINFQDYFTVTLSVSNMNTEYLAFLEGNFEQFYNFHLVHYCISWFRFYIFRKIFNLIFYTFHYMDAVTFCTSQLSFKF